MQERRNALRRVRALLRTPELRTQDEGAATAEYAVVILAAVGFAGLLAVVLSSGEVQQMLTDLVQGALQVGG